MPEFNLEVSFVRFNVTVATGDARRTSASAPTTDPFPGVVLVEPDPRSAIEGVDADFVRRLIDHRLPEETSRAAAVNPWGTFS